mgnify:CR=1 FL=1
MFIPFKHLFSGLLMLGTPLLLQAQSDSSYSTQANASTTDSNTAAMVSIRMEPELERYISLMDSLDVEQQKTFGYRIQIFSSSGPTAKKDALKSQSEFLKLYSEHSAYTAWDYPNWVVRLGDYRNHLEAQEFHDEIKTIYPASFIVKDEIKMD